MATLDFPTAPTIGQYYVAGNGVTYQWNGTMWLPVGGTTGLYIGLTPPPSPGAGQLWFNPEHARLYVYYNDGNTTQWVPSAPIPGTQAIPAVTMPGADPGCKTTLLAGQTSLATTWTNLISTGTIGLANQKWKISAFIAINNNPANWSYIEVIDGAGGTWMNAAVYNSVNGATANAFMERIIVMTAPMAFTLRAYAPTAATAQSGATGLTAERLT